MFSEGHGASNQHVGGFKQDNQLIFLCRFAQLFSSDVGYSFPAALHRFADTKLVMLLNATPKRRPLQWAAGKIRDRSQKGGEVQVEIANRYACRAVRIQRPKEERKEHGPGAACHHQQSQSKSGPPTAGWRAKAADVE